MAPRYTGYEYDTSPRKIEPEYVPSKGGKTKGTQTSSKRTSTKDVKKQIVKKAKEQVKAKNEEKIKRKKLVICICVAFCILLTISYRNSLIHENFAKVKKLKEELAVVEKEKEQLQVNIESSLNLKNVEQVAIDKLGMQRLDNSQKVYVTLPKKDYIQPATEEVQMEEEQNWFQKIINKILGK